MIKVGYIGFGRFAQHRHSILLGISDLNFVGYFDPNRSLVEKYGLTNFESADLLLDELDAVIISVPPFFAADLCKKALSKGVHVFCEKPPATKLSDLEGLDSYPDNLVLAYGFNHRLHDSIMTIKEMVDSNEMGKILWMRGRYGKEVDDTYKDNWRCDKKLNGGGILIDQGIHLLDIMDWLAGGFDVTQAILSDTFIEIEGVEDNAFVNLYCSSTKVTASLHSTITQWRYLFSLEIFLEKGSLVLNGLRTSSGRYGEEILTIRPQTLGGLANDQQLSYSTNKSWGREMESFIYSVKNVEAYPHSGLTEAKNIMKVIESVYSNAIWANQS